MFLRGPASADPTRSLKRPRESQRQTTRRLAASLSLFALVAAACAAPDEGSDPARNVELEGEASSGASGEPVSTSPPTVRFRYPVAPASPDSDVINEDAADAADRLVRGFANVVTLDPTSLDDLTAAGDVRYAWLVADLLGFFGGDDAQRLVESFETITGISIAADPDFEVSSRTSVTNHLIAWDTPDYAGYREDKAALLTRIEPSWAAFFDDADATIDWRYLAWGGVFIDDRALGDPNRCSGGCIPALDDPATTDAAEGDWYPDDRTVFGITIEGESLAIPLNIAEVHEMFNLTIGGRRLVIPYCTLCGSAQAYFTDQADGSPVDGADEIPVGRTSGLLSRSNKVTYDLRTQSVFDTFTGAAVSGPLRESGVVLSQATVVRSTWAEWKREHPDTQLIAQDGGIGRTYDLDPLGDRDDDGPIFPIGDVDDRLDVQEFVVGVLLDDGSALAFPSEEATAAFNAGSTVELGGVALRESGDGLVAVDSATGDEIASHEAFWFAWSQFHPDTLLWAR